MIREYMSKYGKDAYLDFKYENCGKNNRSLRIKRFVGIKSLYDEHESSSKLKLKQSMKSKQKLAPTES